MTDRPPAGGDLDPELLGRFLAGECSAHEEATVRRHLMTHPDAARGLERFLQQLDGGPSRPAPPAAAESWLALRERMQAPAPPVGHERHGSYGSFWRRGRAVRLGAAAVVVACVGLAYAGPGAPLGRSPVGTAPGPATVAEARTFATAARERSDLRLPDGTRVRLAPGSRLRAAADFGAERRDVYLEGEAFFDVVHDERRPFTVFAGNTSARDIGTAFSVRAYPQDSAVVVVVREGVVALSGAGRLRAGDVGRVTAEGRADVTRGIRVDSLLGWMSGRLTYADEPLGAVLEDVRRWYDVDVRLADPSLAALPFTGTLADVPPQAAVELVAATLGLEVRRDGARLLLAPIPGRTPPLRPSR